MCAMSPRLLRPIASGVHPEAADWRARVIANGGTVSGSTLQAVSRLCTSISSAGIRDRFYRLGIFAGDNLNAALVPLYRGPTFGGTTYGNATDTNIGPFVSGDYSESTGLQGNQTTKRLDTGLSPDDMASSGVAHLSVYKGAGSVGANTLFLAGSTSPLGRNYLIRQNLNTDFPSGNWASGALVTASAADTTSGLLTITRPTSSATGSILYKNATLLAVGGSAVAEANPNAIQVFNASAGAAGWPHLLGAYSVGLGLSDDQVTAYYLAVQSFINSLGRA